MFPAAEDPQPISVEAITPSAGDPEQMFMDRLASKLLCSPDNSWQDRTVHQKLAELGMLNRAVSKDYSYYIWDINICTVLPTPGEAKAKAMPGRLYIHT